MSRKHHDLKSFPAHFRPVLEGRKTFEIRRNDRDFQPGDSVTLHEFAPQEGYTGATFSGIIGYIDPFAQQEGYVVFSVTQPGLIIIR